MILVSHDMLCPSAQVAMFEDLGMFMCGMGAEQHFRPEWPGAFEAIAGISPARMQTWAGVDVSKCVEP